ncbi:MAG: hypothetical protein PHE29_00825 [Tissierellia bacterium]|nr:hypothetical protein [Tissierellia bacterium]
MLLSIALIFYFIGTFSYFDYKKIPRPTSIKKDGATAIIFSYEIAE